MSTRSWAPLALAAVLLAGWALLIGLGLPSDGLASTAHYLMQASLEIALGLQFAYLALVAHKRGLASLLSSVLLCAGALLVTVAVADCVALQSVRTVGPSSPMCLSHRNWYARYVRTNELGYWERSLESWHGTGRAGRFVIAIVGDSFTWGQGLRGRDLRFTEQLQSRLRALHGPTVDVLNFSLPGADSVTERERILPDALTLDPDVVMIGYLSNDIRRDRRVGIQIRSSTSSSDLLLRASPTWNALYWHLLAGSLYSDMGLAELLNYYGAFLSDATFGRHLGEVTQLVRAGVSSGCRVIFVILPFPAMWRLVEPSLEEAIYQRIEQAAMAGGASGVIRAHEFERTLPRSRFDVNPLDHHPGPEAQRLIAETIVSWIRERPRFFEPRRFPPSRQLRPQGRAATNASSR